MESGTGHAAIAHALISGGLALVCFLTFFYALGAQAITDSDEAFYAEGGREMPEVDDWLTPHYNYEYRFQKPVLFYWGVALAYQIAGVTPAAARFWSAFSGLAIVLLTMWMARELYEGATGVIAGLIAATSLGLVALARSALPDTPLALFITLATWVLVRPQPTGAADMRPALAAPPPPGLSPGQQALRGPGVPAGLAFGLFCGLGMLTKGPVGLVLPLLVGVPVLFATRRLRPWLGRPALAAAAVFLVVGLGWFGLMALRHGAPYLQAFFVADNLERFLTPRFNEPRPIWYYVPIILEGLFPWSLYLVLFLRPQGGWQNLRRRASFPDRVLAAWVLLPLALFTISIGKQPRYILPLVPPLAVLIAHRVRNTDDRSVLAVTASVALAEAAIGLLLLRARSLFGGGSFTTLAPGLMLLAGAGLLLVTSRRAHPVRTSVTIALTLAFGLAALERAVFVPFSGREPVQFFARAVQDQRHSDEPVAPYRIFVRNLIFYSHMRQFDLWDPSRLETLLTSPERTLCVIEEAEAARFEHEHGIRLLRLASREYVNITSLKLNQLWDPVANPPAQTVVLVANRP